MIISKINRMTMNDKIIDILNEYEHITVDDFYLKNWFEIMDKIISNVDIKKLYIKPKINDIELLKILRNRKISKNKTNSNIYLNEKHININLQNVKKISFISLYPTLIIKLIDNKIIKPHNMYYYAVFKYLFYNRVHFKNTNSYLIVKFLINYYYGVLANYNKKVLLLTLTNFEEFDKYKFYLYDFIKDTLKDDLVYIDTDMFYYIGDKKINFNLPHETENVSALKIYRKKKYVEVIDDIITLKGFKEKI